MPSAESFSEPLENMHTGPLEGLIVADFSRVLAGPYCTMFLGDLGADIIKVETPEGDDSRHWQPPSYQGVASYFQANNRNKRSIDLDFSLRDDLETAKAIAARADIMIHNFKPGSIEKFGLGYPDIRQINPDIIYAHISGFGTGAGENLPGYDVLAQGLAGLMSMNGESDGSPVRSGISLFDLTTGLTTALGILAAVNHRHNTGEGQKIENNLMSSAIFTMANQYQTVATHNHVPTRSGQEHPSLYPYNAFPTAEGELIVVAVNNGQFERLSKVLGRMEWLADERFSTPSKRNINRTALKPLIQEALSSRTKDEWFAIFREEGIPCAPVYDVGEGMDAAIELGLDPVWTGMTGDFLPTIRNPLRMSVTPPTYRTPPPAVGEHQAQIREWISQTQPRS